MLSRLFSCQKIENTQEFEYYRTVSANIKKNIENQLIVKACCSILLHIHYMSDMRQKSKGFFHGMKVYIKINMFQRCFLGTLEEQNSQKIISG